MPGQQMKTENKVFLLFEDNHQDLGDISNALDKAGVNPEQRIEAENPIQLFRKPGRQETLLDKLHQADSENQPMQLFIISDVDTPYRGFIGLLEFLQLVLEQLPRAIEDIHICFNSGAATESDPENKAQDLEALKLADIQNLDLPHGENFEELCLEKLDQLEQYMRDEGSANNRIAKSNHFQRIVPDLRARNKALQSSKVKTNGILENFARIFLELTKEPVA
ncbi:MAG: hypothetical protein OXU45_09925 [Candidatus Melainabacteria bacterium]|nr:hypothetical protein [Candidatus Melainabacteria bacterium]